MRSWRNITGLVKGLARLIRILCTVLLMVSATAAASPAVRALYLPEVTKAARAKGVPPELADAVAMVETGYQLDAIGRAGEIGLMQIMPGTAAQLGYRGNLEDLFTPRTNISLGVDYLARAWAASGGDLCRTLMKYRAGLGEDNMSPLSASYCARARLWLASIGSPLAGGVGMAPLRALVPAAGPRVQSDPHVLVMATALAALRQPVAFHPVRQSYRARQAALSARFASHISHGKLSGAAAQDRDE